MTIFGRFARYALNKKELNVTDAYDAFLRSGISKKEIDFASKHCMLMIRTAEEARKALPEIKKLL